MVKAFLMCGIFLLTDCDHATRMSLQKEAQRNDRTYLIDDAYAYCNKKGLNTDFFFLVDMGRHSGLKRFFVYDFMTRSAKDSFMVSHGCGVNPWSSDKSKTSPLFSNEHGSHLSSLGKYIIGQRGYSQWGINVKYLLHGMEKTNSNALARTIVFHSWEAVGENETFPEGTPEGWGCPAVSNNSMKIIDSMLRKRNDKTLMWIVK